MSDNNIPQIDLVHLEHLDLELYGVPTLPYIAVFIRDPENQKIENQEIYWFRKFGVKPSSVDLQDKTLPFVDIEEIDMEEYNVIPCREGTLEKAIKKLTMLEEQVGQEPTMQHHQAVPAIARYNGPEKFTLDEMMTLVALKYQSMRA